jgi:hypothetical protein
MCKLPKTPRPLKIVIPVLILWFSMPQRVGQVLVADALEPTKESVLEFIISNKFDYALIGWSTSNWMSFEDRYSCFVKKNNQSFLVKVTITKPATASNKNGVQVTPKQLNNTEASKLLKKLNISGGIRYSQEQIDSIPMDCSFYRIHDSGQVHLMEYFNQKVKALDYYAPKYFLENCLKLDARF